MRLLERDVVDPTKGPVFLNRLFEVPKRDSPESRLVLDLSRMNLYVRCYPFKMLTVPHVRLSLRPRCWLASLDLKYAFWHVPIHPRYRPFLAFPAGNGQAYQFKVMPLGLIIAPGVFTKLMKPVKSRLTEQGVQIFMYLDDWLVV